MWPKNNEDTGKAKRVVQNADLSKAQAVLRMVRFAPVCFHPEKNLWPWSIPGFHHIISYQIAATWRRFHVGHQESTLESKLISSHGSASR